MTIDKRAQVVLGSFLVVMFLLVASLAMAGGPKPECRDKIDNDGDGRVDLQDAGCSGGSDNDETNCGDAVCEGGETYLSCAADCTPPDSCSDTDGGNVTAVSGTVSGYLAGVPYSSSDYCIGDSSINEYYCSGAYVTNQQASCGTDGYTGSSYCGADGNVYRDYADYLCSAGACSSTTTSYIQQTCQYGCTNGSCNPAPPQPADLVIANLTFYEASGGGNGTVSVTVTAAVQNIGNGDASASQTQLIAAGTGTFWKGTPALTPGQTAFVSQTYDCLYGGHTLTATADYYNSVAESNEANNQATTYVDCII